MKQLLFFLCLGCAITSSSASERWNFSKKVPLSSSPTSGIYHHLDGAGRKHIAVSSESVAVIWEDNRSGDPVSYAARKGFGDQQFTPAFRVSDGAEAYEPAIAALEDDRYLLAWEQDGGVHARILSSTGLGKKRQLAGGSASHVSVSSLGDRSYAVWREQSEGNWFVRVAALAIDQHTQISIASITSIEKKGINTQILFPSVAAHADGVCVAWEDRRAGNTRLLASNSVDRAQSFTEPEYLNEFFSDRNEYDRGNGVTRVSLATFADDEVLAAWMDKRRGGVGYGIYASLGAEGCGYFGPNEKVHGPSGNDLPHYNPSTAGNRSGDFAITWDDYRNGDSDIWFAYYNSDDEWSETSQWHW